MSGWAEIEQDGAALLSAAVVDPGVLSAVATYPSRDMCMNRISFLIFPRLTVPAFQFAEASTDLAKQLALLGRRTGVDVYAYTPRGARLVLVPGPDHHHVPPAQIDVAMSPVGYAPTNGELAVAVLCSRTRAAVNHPAWTDRVAVARFEVRPGDAPFGHSGSV